MPLPPPGAGWSRFLVKSKFGAGRDFIVSDPDSDAERYFVDGKLGQRPSAEITGGGSLYLVRGTLLRIPKRMIISAASGAEVATLKAKMFSPIKSQMTVDMTSGEPWTLEGSVLADGIDPGLAVAVLWSVDRWVEQDGAS